MLCYFYEHSMHTVSRWRVRPLGKVYNVMFMMAHVSAVPARVGAQSPLRVSGKANARHARVVLLPVAHPASCGHKLIRRTPALSGPGLKPGHSNHFAQLQWISATVTVLVMIAMHLSPKSME